jgi:hypothetical protein
LRIDALSAPVIERLRLTPLQPSGWRVSAQVRASALPRSCAGLRPPRRLSPVVCVSAELLCDSLGGAGKAKGKVTVAHSACGAGDC